MITPHSSLSHLIQNNNDNVHSVGFGYRIKDGKILDELAIHFGVTSKKPISDIDPNDLIPETIEIDGVNYSTDVVEYPSPEILSCNFGDPSENIKYRRPILGGSQIRGGVPNQSGDGTLGFVAVS